MTFCQEEANKLELCRWPRGFKTHWYDFKELTFVDEHTVSVLKTGQAHTIKFREWVTGKVF